MRTGGVRYGTARPARDTSDPSRERVVSSVHRMPALLQLAAAALAFIGSPALLGAWAAEGPVSDFPNRPPAAEEERGAERPATGPKAPVRTDPPRRYAGRTLDEWRETIKSLVPADPASAVYVPGLIELVRDPEVPAITRRQAAATLGRIGRRASDAVSHLVELIDAPPHPADDPEYSTASWAMKALAQFGPAARDAAPRLAAVLRDEGRPVGERLTAIEALSRIGAEHPAVVPALIDALQPPGDDSSGSRAAAELRGYAAESLGVIGPAASAAVPALVRAAEDPDPDVRRKAVVALGEMRDAAVPALATLVASLAFDESTTVRDVAAEALARIGGPAVPILARLLADRDESVRLRAASALAAAGDAARPAAGALERAVEDESPVVRLKAAEALWRAAGDSERAVRVALEALASQDRQQRIAASRLLVEIAPHRPGVAQAIEPLARSADAQLRRAAEETLEKIARDPRNRQ